MSCLIFAERRWPSGIPAVMRGLESGCNCTRTPENMVSEPLSPWASSVTPETLSACDGCTTSCAFAVARVVDDGCPSAKCAAALVRVFTVARAADDGCTAAGVGCACSTFGWPELRGAAQLERVGAQWAEAARSVESAGPGLPGPAAALPATGLPVKDHCWWRCGWFPQTAEGEGAQHCPARGRHWWFGGLVAGWPAPHQSKQTWPFGSGDGNV